MHLATARVSRRSALQLLDCGANLAATSAGGLAGIAPRPAATVPAGRDHLDRKRFAEMGLQGIVPPLSLARVGRMQGIMQHIINHFVANGATFSSVM